MRIAIIYPPITRNGKTPLLGQNRQFKYTNSRQIKIFPLVPASMATMLKQNGHEVLWLDAINKPIHDSQFTINNFKPDIIVIETKAPIIKEHWKYINELRTPNSELRIVLVGDHVSFFPEESLENSEADYVVTGGDYDITVSLLVKHLEDSTVPMPAGVHYKCGMRSAECGVKEQKDKSGMYEFRVPNSEFRIENTGKPELYPDLDSLPFIDRELTDFRTYGEAYLYRPVAYILSGRGCGREGKEIGGVCTFCIWQHAFWQKKARLRSPANTAEEVEMLIKKYGVYEIFDDNESGAIWNREWLEGFLAEIEKRNIKGRFRISSNARAEDLTEEKCALMKNIGYRLLKVGLESGNSGTIKKIGKLETIEVIKENIKRAKRYGFKILMTMMVGYPWETAEDAKRTFETAKELMLYKTHFGDSLQASIIMPYPGTPLYKEAKEKGWLTEAAADYENFDMEHDILKSDIDTAYWCRKIWGIHKHPLFLFKSLITIRNMRDFGLAMRGLSSLLGHVKDY